MKRRGFTLIEVLVVFAIIAVLAAILLPVFAAARAKARQTTCQSNLKQVYMAWVMYAADYDGMAPWWSNYPCCPTGYYGYTAPTWWMVLAPYWRYQGARNDWGDPPDCPEGPEIIRREHGGDRWCRYIPNKALKGVALDRFLESAGSMVPFFCCLGDSAFFGYYKQSLVEVDFSRTDANGRHEVEIMVSRVTENARQTIPQYKYTQYMNATEFKQFLEAINWKSHWVDIGGPLHLGKPQIKAQWARDDGSVGVGSLECYWGSVRG
jgi:prepilin-type N-terminal cleavage/methylation domain-containing protein